MICENCSNWKCEKLTYDEVLTVWQEHIGDEITPGYKKRYAKMAQLQGTPFEEVSIGFKYCSAGIFNRLYLMKNDRACKPNRFIKECPSFRSENEGLEIKKCSPLWKLCIRDSHGVTEENGMSFGPGLYEIKTYMRIPFYEGLKPQIEKGNVSCSVCGEEAQRSIVIRLEKFFCCNKHYLECWARRHREEYRRLNKWNGL